MNPQHAFHLSSVVPPRIPLASQLHVHNYEQATCYYYYTTITRVSMRNLFLGATTAVYLAPVAIEI